MNQAVVLNENFVIKQVDTKQVFRIGLTCNNGANPELSGATAKIYIANASGLVAEKSMTVLSAESVVTFQLDDGDIPASGTYDVEIVVTYGDGKRETFPDSDYLKLRVLPNLSSR